MLLKLEVCGFTRTYNVVRLEGNSSVENQNDLELDFKVFFLC